MSQAPSAPPPELAESLPDRLLALRNAQAQWAGQPMAQRVGIIARLRARLADEAASLAGAVNLPQRSRAFETLSAEVLPLVEACRWLTREAPRILAPQTIGSRSRPWWGAGHGLRTYRDPLGVVLIIGPGNFPLMLPGIQALHALVAGNAVVIKPGQAGGASLQQLRAMLVDAGLDSGLVWVTGEEPHYAENLIDLGVDKLVFTGSAATGRKVLARAAQRLTPAVVELSGCDAVFVLPSAEPERVRKALLFGLRINGGQTCIAPRRVFLLRSHWAAIAEPVIRAVADWPGIPVPRAAADRAQRAVAAAVAAGGRLACGAVEPAGANGSSTGDGQAAEGHVAFAASIVVDPPRDADLVCEDLFAPVMSITLVDSPDEALRLAAECPYRLGASVFGARREAEQFARRVDAGCVTINDLIAPTADPRLAFGGRGRSGFGVTRGAEGLLEMTQIKSVLVQSARWLPHLDPPHDRDEPLMLGLIRALHAGTLGQRWAGLQAAWRAMRSGDATS